MELKEVFEPIINFIKGFQKKEPENSKEKAKERLKLVLYQDRASVSPDYFEMMKKELVEVIKKYVDIDEEMMEVELTRLFEDGLDGPALVANIPIKNFKPVAKKVEPKKEEVIVNKENVEEIEEAIEEVVEELVEEVVEESESTKGEEKVEETNEEVKQEIEEEIKEEEKKEEIQEQKEEVKEETVAEEKESDEKKTEVKKETKKKTQSKSKKTTKK